MAEPNPSTRSVTAYPIAQAVFDSLFDYRLTDPTNTSFVGLANYGLIITDSVWWISFGVTAFIMTLTIFPVFEV